MNKEKQNRMFESHEQQYLDMMNQWMILKHSNVMLEQYFVKQNWKKIAIYGMGIYGRHLIRELKGSRNCNVTYGIDRKNMEPYESVPIHLPEDLKDSEKVDVIVNTIIFDKKLDDSLKLQFDTNVVNLEDVIFEAYSLKG